MELQWIGAAFLLGMLAKRVGMPPLTGFLLAGFGLELLGVRPDASLRELSQVGIQLLLFSLGLKLDVRALASGPVLGGMALPMALITLASTVGLLLVAGTGGVRMDGPLDLRAAATLGFALSFSSTVLAVKVLEERDEMDSAHGRLVVGILLLQDVAAVGFMAASKGTWPSPWALGLPALIPLRASLQRLLDHTGDGELKVLAGIAAALGGAALFEGVGLKADLGALAAGILLGGHGRSAELALGLRPVKQVFLVGFFLSVGFVGLPTTEMVYKALWLTALLPLKAALFVGVLQLCGVSAGTAWLAGAGLTSLSEFGLIVTGAAVERGWLDESWLVVMAIAMSLSFAASALVGRLATRLRPAAIATCADAVAES